MNLYEKAMGMSRWLLGFAIRRELLLSERSWLSRTSWFSTTIYMTRSMYCLILLLPIVLLAVPYLAFCQSAQKGQRSTTIREPLPDFSETPAFTYTREPQFAGTYRISPTNGAPSYLVSESFLQLTLGSSNVDSQQQENMLRLFPAMNENLFQHIMGQAYPDASRTYNSRFASQVLRSSANPYMLLEQDPSAEPYIRITMENADGSSAAFSMARSLVEDVLARRNLTDEQRIEALRSFPYHLPEEARHNFASLSAADMAHLVQNTPALQDQEFVKMRHIYLAMPQEPLQQDKATPTLRHSQEHTSRPRQDLATKGQETRLQHLPPHQRHEVSAEKMDRERYEAVDNPKTAASKPRTLVGGTSQAKVAQPVSIPVAKAESGFSGLRIAAVVIFIVGIGMLALARRQRD